MAAKNLASSRRRRQSGNCPLLGFRAARPASRCSALHCAFPAPCPTPELADGQPRRAPRPGRPPRQGAAPWTKADTGRPPPAPSSAGYRTLDQWRGGERIHRPRGQHRKDLEQEDHRPAKAPQRPRRQWGKPTQPVWHAAMIMHAGASPKARPSVTDTAVGGCCSALRCQSLPGGSRLLLTASRRTEFDVPSLTATVCSSGHRSAGRIPTKIEVVG